MDVSMTQRELLEFADNRKVTQIFSINQLTEMPPPSWMIEGLFEANSLIMVAGPPGSFKSFLVLDWLLCMASGRSWQARSTTPAKVLYVLGEGRSSLLKRINTWIGYNRLSDVEREQLNLNFRVTFDVPQMAQQSTINNLLMSLEVEGFKPDVIAIDTFARSFVGMDENAQKDVGLWVESADRLRSAGFTVIFLHHTAKNTEFGVRYRGSTAILGAMDTAITVQRDSQIPGGVKLEVTKQKDHDEGDPIYLSRLIVGDSIVLTGAQVIDERFTEAGRKMLKMIDELYVDPSFESDAARGRELARHFDITEEAAKKRFERKRKTQVPDVALTT